MNERTKYLLTLPLRGADEGEFSVFTSFSEDVFSPTSITRNTCQFFTARKRLVQVVFHARSRRAARSPLRAAFDPCSIEIGQQFMDETPEVGDQIWTHHKLGGLPFLYEPRRYLLDMADELLKSGWVQLVQLSSLGHDDVDVGEGWPIWNQMFHVFARSHRGRVIYRWLIA